MKKTLLDSSFLFSVINHQDAHHTACVQIVLDTSWEKHILPTVIPELSITHNSPQADE